VISDKVLHFIHSQRLDI